MEYKKINMPGLLHGGDYNPEQWLDRPDILEEDIRLMKLAHVNNVSLGIFSWAFLEPEEGKYQFDYLEEIINRLYDNGIYTNLATPTGAMPNWMTQKYPEVMQTDENGIQNLPGIGFLEPSFIVAGSISSFTRNLVIIPANCCSTRL